MNTIGYQKFKFVCLRFLLFIIIVALLGIIISFFLHKNYLLAIVFFLLLFLFFIFVGKKVAAIFLGKRVLQYVNNYNGLINVLQLEAKFGYSKTTIDGLIDKFLKNMLVEINEEGTIKITEKGLEQLKIWGE